MMNFEKFPTQAARAFAFFSMWAVMLFSESTAASKPYLLAVDYSNFRVNNQTCVEIYSQVAHSILNFIIEGKTYQSRFEITAVLLNKKNELVKEKTIEYKATAENYEATLAPEKNVLFQFQFMVEPGKYNLEIILRDKNSGKEIKKIQTVNVANFNTRELILSDIQIAARIEASKEKSELVKNGLKIVPNPLRCYDSGFSRAYFNFEVYNLSKATEKDNCCFTFAYSFYNSENEVLASYSNSLQSAKSECALNFVYPIEFLKAGEYRLEVEIIDEFSQTRISRSAPFWIYRSPAELQYFAFGEVLEMLKIIASREEIQQIGSVAEDKHQMALNNFWKSKDPIPETTTNELLNDFSCRLAYVQQNYATRQCQGWKTDRGRTFIRFGSPDIIYQSPTDFNQEKSEKWIYQDQNLTFIFIDQNGFGDFRLTVDSFLGDL